MFYKFLTSTLQKSQDNKEQGNTGKLSFIGEEHGNAMTKYTVWYPGSDPRMEKGHYLEHWCNQVKVHSLDNNV